MKIKLMTIRKIGNKGRIVLPKEMTEMLGINPNDNLTIKVIESNKKLSIKIEKEKNGNQ